MPGITKMEEGRISACLKSLYYLRFKTPLLRYKYSMFLDQPGEDSKAVRASKMGNPLKNFTDYAMIDFNLRTPANFHFHEPSLPGPLRLVGFFDFMPRNPPPTPPAHPP